MFGCKGRGILIGSVAAMAASPAGADAGRMKLMAGEVAGLVTPSAAEAAGASWWLVGALFTATLVAAFLGTWLGLRALTVGKLSGKDGWREVAYRFRSEEPMTVGKDMIHRMTGVLDEIEDLGRKLGDAPRTAPAEDAPAEEPVERLAPDPDGIETIEAAQEPAIRFARRDGLAPVPVPTPIQLVEEEAATPAPRPIARTRGDRAARYREARELLAEGRDRDEIRALTGLKAAELDLLRSAPGVAA